MNEVTSVLYSLYGGKQRILESWDERWHATKKSLGYDAEW